MMTRAKGISIAVPALAGASRVARPLRLPSAEGYRRSSSMPPEAGSRTAWVTGAPSVAARRRALPAGVSAKEGDAYTFMSPDEIAMVRTIERVIGQPIPRISVPGYDFGTVAAD